MRISEGFFSGYHALVQEFIGKMKSSTASKRAKVALEYFGRMTTLECRQGRPIDCSASFSNPMMEGPGADSEEKREPASDVESESA